MKTKWFFETEVFEDNTDKMIEEVKFRGMEARKLEELSQEYDGKVDIYKIDTEDQHELAAAFGIRSIPSLLFIPAEGQPQMAMGALPKEAFKQAIEEVLEVK